MMSRQIISCHQSDRLLFLYRAREKEGVRRLEGTCVCWDRWWDLSLDLSLMVTCTLQSRKLAPDDPVVSFAPSGALPAASNRTMRRCLADMQANMHNHKHRPTLSYFATASALRQPSRRIALRTYAAVEAEQQADLDACEQPTTSGRVELTKDRPERGQASGLKVCHRLTICQWLLKLLL